MKFIVLNGPRRSGKNTARSIIKDYVKAHTARRDVVISFKNILYHAVSVRYGVPFKEVMRINNHPVQKLVADPRFNGQSVVDAIIYESEEIIKKKFGPTAVAERAIRNFDRYYPSGLPPKTVIINSDGGFIDELQYVADHFNIPSKDFIIIRLMRDGCDFKGDSRSYLDNPHSVIENNGTREDFKEKIHNLLKEIL